MKTSVKTGSSGVQVSDNVEKVLKPIYVHTHTHIYSIYNHNWRNISTVYIYIYIYIYIKQDQHQTKYSHHRTKYIGKQVGLRTYQHSCLSATVFRLCARCVVVTFLDVIPDPTTCFAFYCYVHEQILIRRVVWGSSLGGGKSYFCSAKHPDQV